MILVYTSILFPSMHSTLYSHLILYVTYNEQNNSIPQFNVLNAIVLLIFNIGTKKCLALHYCYYRPLDKKQAGMKFEFVVVFNLWRNRLFTGDCVLLLKIIQTTMDVLGDNRTVRTHWHTLSVVQS